jgi:hypothetical protein
LEDQAVGGVPEKIEEEIRFRRLNMKDVDYEVTGPINGFTTWIDP